MNVSVLFLLLLVEVGCANIDAYENAWSQDIDDVIIVAFDFLHESKYDMEALKRNRKLEDDVSFLFVEEVPLQKNLEKLEEEGNFVYTEVFDFDSNWMIIAYGRKLVEIECVSSKYIRNHYGSQFYSLSATFGEDYFDNTVFFYKIAKEQNIGIIRTHYELFTYVMVGTEKVQIYMNSINKPKRTGLEGVG